VKHLVLCALRDSGDVKSVHVAKDKTQVFERVDDPLDKLEDLLQAWQQGQQSPLPFFPAASLEFVEKKNDLDKARKKWETDYDSGLNNWFVQVAFRGREPVAEAAFEEWADKLLAPLVDASRIISAKKDL